MLIDIQISEPNNALSVISTFNFETTFVSMFVKSQNKTIAKEKHFSLEDYSEESPSLIDSESNMMSVIEMPNINKGFY